MRESKTIGGLLFGLCLVFSVNNARAAQASKLATAKSYVDFGDKAARQGNYDQAIGAYTIALQFDPNLAVAYANRAYVLGIRKEFGKAFSDWAAALAINPSLTTALYDRGSLRLNEGDVSGALEDFDRAVICDPYNAMVYNNRGIARRVKGDIEGAIRRFQRGNQTESPTAGSLCKPRPGPLPARPKVGSRT